MSQEIVSINAISNLDSFLEASTFRAPDTRMSILGSRLVLNGVVKQADGTANGWNEILVGLNYIRWAYVIDRAERVAL